MLFVCSFAQAQGLDEAETIFKEYKVYLDSVQNLRHSGDDRIIRSEVDTNDFQKFNREVDSISTARINQLTYYCTHPTVTSFETRRAYEALGDYQASSDLDKIISYESLQSTNKETLKLRLQLWRMNTCDNQFTSKNDSTSQLLSIIKSPCAEFQENPDFDDMFSMMVLFEFIEDDSITMFIKKETERTERILKSIQKIKAFKE